ncbi:MAG: choice-of-anchor D domain-containing protein [Chlorobi bacterium]|nr:choice-of-anchor D domain-containing protein [Chlorobiota bacterium]
MRDLRYTLASLALILVGTSLCALGPTGGSGTTATVYSANRFPLSYQTDQGDLGAFNNTQATAIVDFSFSEWENLATATLSFTNAGQIDHNVTSATDPLISGIEQFSDGIFPVIFDDNGSITDDRIGVGASRQVYGFASSVSRDGLKYQEGYVIINGSLASRPDVEPIYREAVTHEIGHMLGIGHSQVNLGAKFSLMYPISLTNVDNPGLDPDDAASMSLLYPAPGYLESVGSISGTITNSNGSPLSGINVIALNTTTGDVYSTVSDYFSGDNALFRNKPARTGAYIIRGLPPGNYYVGIEPVNSRFQGGSRVASYLTPINTDTWKDWYNGPEESGNMLTDNSNEKTVLSVTAGNVTSGIDIVANYSSTQTELTAFNGTTGQTIDLPFSFGNSNRTLGRLATRYTAPTNGSLLGFRIFFGAASDMPNDGSLKVTVYTNTQGSLAGIPGEVLGSVTIPFSELSAGHDNDIWLHDIGLPINFSQAQQFHVGIEIEGNGHLVCRFDNAQGTQNQTSYLIEENQSWRNFPDGLSSDAAGWNLDASILYTTVRAGVPTPLIALSQNNVEFATTRLGEKTTQELQIQNVGTANLEITNLLIGGSNHDKFSIESGGGAFSLKPWQTRTLSLGFTPEDRPEVSAILNIFHNAAGSPTAVNLSGSGKAAILNSVPESLDFEGQAVNKSRTEEFAVLRNTGNDSLRIFDVEINGPDAPSFDRRSYTPLVWVGLLQTFKARIAFRPTEERAYNATLRVTHNLDSSPLEIPITGTGTEDIGSVTEIRSGSFRVALLGTQPNPIQGQGEIIWQVEGIGRLPVELMMIDAAGRTVLHQDHVIYNNGGKWTKAFPVDLSRFPAGLYQVALRSKYGTAVRKVVVVR